MHRKTERDRSVVSLTHLWQKRQKICTTVYSACSDNLLVVTGAMVPTNIAKCHPLKQTY